MKIAIRIIQVLVGLLFLFSGTVKAIDPVGSAIKFNDYFTAFGLPQSDTVALLLAVFLNLTEFIVGFSLFFNVKTRLGILGALLFMILFTPLTLYLAISNAVSDCGCFGDFIKMTNWETFNKNLVISVLVVFLFVFRKRTTPYFNLLVQWILIGIGVLLVLAFQWYNHTYEPIADFRPYKEGVNINEAMRLPEGAQSDTYVTYYTMKNNASGETKKVSSEEYMSQKIWEDTTFVITETSEPVLLKKGYTPPIHDFSLLTLYNPTTGNLHGTDITQEALQSDKPVIFIVSYDIQKADFLKLQKVADFMHLAQQSGVTVYFLTGSSAEVAADICAALPLNADITFCTTDPTQLKTLMRANPGAVLLNKGTIIKKWSEAALPSPADFQTYIQNLTK